MRLRNLLTIAGVLWLGTLGLVLMYSSTHSKFDNSKLPMETTSTSIQKLKVKMTNEFQQPINNCSKTGNVSVCNPKIVATGQQKKFKIPNEKGLVKGNLLYNRITSFWLGETESVELVLSSMKIDTFGMLLATKGKKKTHHIQLTKIVSAELLGSSELEVSPNLPLAKRVSSIQPTRFHWKVHPRKVSDHARLILNIYVHHSEGPPFLVEPTFSDSISVRIRPWQYVGTIFSPIFVAIGGIAAFVASVLAILSFWKEKRHQKSSKRNLDTSSSFVEGGELEDPPNIT